MTLIPGGPFIMGSDQEPHEQPVREVEVRAFYIDTMEVAVADFLGCVAAGACDEPPTRDEGGPLYNYMVKGKEDHPINGMRWFDAAAYCGWVAMGAKRLPTEAEWEKAARGPDARVYPWGDSPEPSCAYTVMDQENVGNCYGDGTQPIGSRPLGVSYYGVHDMSGNVWEWVSDWYDAGYHPADVDNPTGPEAGRLKIFRGGSWDNEFGPMEDGYFRSSFRLEDDPGSRHHSVGIRCAQDVAGTDLRPAALAPGLYHEVAR